MTRTSRCQRRGPWRARPVLGPLRVTPAPTLVRVRTRKRSSRRAAVPTEPAELAESPPGTDDAPPPPTAPPPIGPQPGPAAWTRRTGRRRPPLPADVQPAAPLTARSGPSSRSGPACRPPGPARSRRRPARTAIRPGPGGPQPSRRVATASRSLRPTAAPASPSTPNALRPQGGSHELSRSRPRRSARLRPRPPRRPARRLRFPQPPAPQPASPRPNALCARRLRLPTGPPAPQPEAQPQPPFQAHPGQPMPHSRGPQGG